LFNTRCLTGLHDVKQFLQAPARILYVRVNPVTENFGIGFALQFLEAFGNVPQDFAAL
jgi:hypothetical protein